MTGIVGALLRRRKELKLNQFDIAKRLKCSVTKVLNIEQGMTELKLNDYFKWCEALYIQPESLLFPESVLISKQEHDRLSKYEVKYQAYHNFVIAHFHHNWHAVKDSDPVPMPNQESLADFIERYEVTQP